MGCQTPTVIEQAIVEGVAVPHIWRCSACDRVLHPQIHGSPSGTEVSVILQSIFKSSALLRLDSRHEGSVLLKAPI